MTDQQELLIDEIRQLRETGEALLERVEDVAASIRYMTNNLLDDEYHPQMAESLRDLARNVDKLAALPSAAREGEAVALFGHDVKQVSQQCATIVDQSDREVPLRPPNTLPEWVIERVSELVVMLQELGEELAEEDQFGEEAAYLWWENRFEAIREVFEELDQFGEQAAAQGLDLKDYIRQAGGIPEALQPHNWPDDFVEAFTEEDASPEDDSPNLSGRGDSPVNRQPKPRQQELFEPVANEATASPAELNECAEESSPVEPAVSEFRESQGQGGMDSLSTIPEVGHHGPYTLDDYRAFCQRRLQEQLSADQWKAEYARLRASREAFVEQLVQNNNAQRLKALAMRAGCLSANQQTKPENAAAVYQACLRGFVLGNSVCYNPMSETYEEAVDRIVAALTDADFAKHQAEQQQHQAEQEKALTNPETLGEFAIFIREKGVESLSDEQHLRRDQLYADLSRKTRAEAKSSTVEHFRAEDLESLEFSIIEGYHEKRDCPVWIVQMSTRVERQAYEELKRKAAQLGGWYSSFKKNQAGFQFLSRESAEKLAGLKDGDADRSDELDDRRIRKLDNVAERFSAMASRLAEQAEATLAADDGKLKNTARRAEQAASTRASARADLATAATLRSLASQLREGEATYLDGIRYAVQIETLRAILRRARWTHIRHVMQTDYADLSNYDRHLKQDQLELRPLDASDVRFAEYPKPYLQRGHLERAIAQLANTNGVKQVSEKMRKAVARTPQGQDFVELYRECDIALLEDFVGRARSAGYNCYWFDHCLDGYKRLRSANIHDAHELRAALAELLPHLNPVGKDDPIAVAIDALRGKELPGFFPTPRPVILRMLELAEIQGDDRVLEPSCGMADILDAIREAHPDVDLKGIERNHTLADVLAAKGFDEIVSFSDFMEHHGPYDRILMNPPFENGAEIDHVRHAFELLSVGGRLVSVMSKGPFFRSDSKSREFREWLDGQEHDVEPLPEDAFRGVEAFRQTDVQTCLVVINRT